MGSGYSALWAEVGRKHKTLRADVISEKCPQSQGPCVYVGGSAGWPDVARVAWDLSVDPVSTA